ncbi:TIGR04222 domain-containing membrane protein [Xanthomonas melonis]|uniref:TIGR04222 domain-containing membrane protein n=1 Tax=Xanthomonas melonis TaxID=56456 RepID=UPI003EBE168A
MTDRPDTVPPAPMAATLAQLALWQRLQHDRFGDDAQALPAFVQRVASQVRCSTAQAQRLVEEYRRFCFLACTDSHDVTPSPPVDQVWHTHLTDTREYWQRFCPQVLQTSLHHRPGRGGADDAARFQAQYRRTLERYRTHFGEPPASCWPPAPPQPAVSMQRSDDTSEAMLRALRGLPPQDMSRQLPRALIGWTLLAAVMAWLGAASSAGVVSPLQWRGVQFLCVFIALIGVAWSMAAWLRRVLRRGRAAGTLEAAELAYLSGGADRVADLWCTELLVRDAVSLQRDEREPAYRWVACQPQATVTPALEPALQILRTTEDPLLALRALRAQAAPLKQGLIDKGLWLTGGAAAGLRLISTVPVALVWLLGACKLVIGVQGNHPVGYLLGLIVLTSALVLGFALVPVRRTLAGDACLQTCRQALRRDAARNGGDPAEAVALYGTVALVGTAWADYHSLRAPHGHDGGSGSTCGGGGDGGDGGSSDGGGGCGGCGGGGD